MFDRLTRFFVKRSYQSYRPIHILMAILFGGSLELLFIPILLIVIGKVIDRALGFGPLLPTLLVPYAAMLCLLIGIPWLASSIYWQHKYGKGTPLPLVPTKVFLNTGPYRYTRNPMTLGAIFWLSGWAVLANSPAALFGGVTLFVIIGICYIKLVEEYELEQRFGTAYQKYKKETPFLIPGLKK